MTENEPGPVPPAPEDGDEARASRRPVRLSNLYLDPNNYRFIDHPDYRPVPPERVLDKRVQRDTQVLLRGLNNKHIEDLLASFTENGWLDIEPIHVRRLERGRFLVVEGNRRVATLKHLEAQYATGAGLLGALDPAIFERVPTVLYGESSPVQDRLVMALHHVSGKRLWPPYNQARLLRELQDDHGMTPDQICRAVGIKKRAFNLAVRSLALCDQYQRSDFGDQFQSEKFSYFQEVLKSPALRAWIGWDEATGQATHAVNRERLFSWLSHDIVADDTAGEATLGAGVRAEAGEPAIASALQIRELARIIEDPAAVRELEESRSLQTASMASGVLIKSEVDAALKRSEQDVQRLFRLASTMDPAELGRVERLQEGLRGVLATRGHAVATAELSQTPWPVFSEIRQTHFQAIHIERYRGLRDLRIEVPGQINLFAGLNNVGKTSILEALHLLAQQADPRAALEIARRRARREGLPAGPQLQRLLPEEARLGGRFDAFEEPEAEVILRSATQPPDAGIDRATFVGAFHIEARYAGRGHRSVTTLSTNAPPRITAGVEGRVLCRSVFTSPFSLSQPDVIERANAQSAHLGIKPRIIEFLRAHLCPGLLQIELIDGDHGFLVTEEDRTADLSTYGEGMQRVFLLAMLVALAQDGVLLIDEFENAVHVGLLRPLAHLLHSLARSHNVQIFLTTHSQEAIEAWTAPELACAVVGYSLRPDRPIGRVDGPRLSRLIELTGLDLRGRP